MLFNYKSGLKELFNRMGSYLPGQIAKSGWKFVETLNSVATNPPIEFGSVIKRVTEEGKVPYALQIQEDDTPQTFYGIAVRDVVSQSSSDYVSENANFITSYCKGFPISIMRQGYICVPVQNGSPRAGGQVYVRVKPSVDNPSLPIGGIEALATEGTIAWKNATFESGSYFPTQGTNISTSDNELTSQCATIYIQEAEYGIEGIEVTSPNDITAVYGTYLNTIPLEGGNATYNGENIAGRFVINNGNEFVPVGEYTLTCTFIPNNPEFESVTNVPIKVTITKATPIVSVNPVTNKDLYYGDGLFELNLVNGVANVSGKFEWEEPNTRPQRTSTQLAQFVPTDTHNYETITNINVTVTVEQVPIHVSIKPTASAIASGAELNTSILSNGSVVEIRNPSHVVAGEWQWSEPDTIVIETGNHVAIFVPENTAKYGDTPTEIKVTVI